MVAELESQGAAASVGLVYAFWCGASAVGGLFYGAWGRQVHPYLLMALFAVATVPLALVDGVWALALASIPSGLLTAPTLASASSRLSHLVVEERRGEAMGFYGSAMTAGAAMGAPLAGVFIDGVAPSAGYVFAAAAGFVVTAVRQQRMAHVAVVGDPQAHVGMGRSGRLGRAESAGVTVVCDTRVTRIDVQGGRATGVVDSTGRRWPAKRAVLADVAAPTLYTELLSADDVPARVLDDLRTFTWDTPVVKVNYALREKIPWRSTNLSGAGTIHLGADARNIAYGTADIETGRVPEHPFLLFGQMTTADPGRSPAGTESAWSYSHLPRGVTDDEAAQLLARRMDAVLEAHAPGVFDLIVGRHVQTPHDLQAADANLVHGTVNGGTAQLFQQLIFRPTPNLGGASTPVDRLYLAGSGAHPGGGVHGACGNNAARAALASDGFRGFPRRVFDRNVIRRLTKTDNNH